MPSRLKPTNPIASDAILVGDPGRALMLAQALLVSPLMSNHARGLWGYTAATAEGSPLSIQSTGMGGPSAAIVLSDLVKLGLRRAVRVGTCESLRSDLPPGSLVLVESAIAGDGTSRSLTGTPAGDSAEPVTTYADAHLLGALSDTGPAVQAISIDLAPSVRSAAGLAEPEIQLPEPAVPEKIAVTDLQTAALFALGKVLGVRVAAILVVERTRIRSLPTESSGMEAERLEVPLKRAGEAAAQALSNPEA